MSDELSREITDYLDAQKKQDENLEVVAKVLAGLFNTLVEHGVPEQWVAGMTMAYFWTLSAQKGK